MKFVIFAVFSLNLFAYGQEQVCRCDCRTQVEQMYIREGFAIGNEPILESVAQASPWCTNYVNNILMANSLKEQQVVGRAIFKDYYERYEIYMCEGIKKGQVLGVGASDEEAKQEALKVCRHVMQQHLNVSTPDVQYEVNPKRVFLEKCYCFSD